MTDENNTGAFPAPTAAASSEQTIPKQRFDELIADRNELRQQTQMLQQTLNQLVQNQRPAQRPREEAPEMRELREQNPALYKRLAAQDQAIRESRALNSELIDGQDRINFVTEYGEEAKKNLKKVEDLLRQERAAGNFKVSRQGVYLWLKGQEQLQRSVAPEPTVVTQQAPQAKVEEIPSSDPSNARFVNGAQAPSGFSSATPTSREEQVKQMRDRLKNQSF